MSEATRTKIIGGIVLVVAGWGIYKVLQLTGEPVKKNLDGVEAPKKNLSGVSVWTGSKNRYRPEKMRVEHSEGYYLVQTFSETQNKWITQKEYKSKVNAIDDAKNWYKKK